MENENDITIHPDATYVFNEKAEKYFSMIIEQAPGEQPRTTDFNPEIEPKAALNESDISGLKFTGTTDPLGRETSKFFERNGNTYGISGSSYIEVMKFIDQVAKVNAISNTLSRSFIRDNYFEWLEVKLKESADTDWVSFLLEGAKQVVQTHEVWIPISELHLQQDIQLGKITFFNMNKNLFECDVLSKLEVERINEQEREGVFKTLRQQYQGYAIAKLRVWSEPTKAVEMARKETEISLNLLTCYHLAWCKGELLSSSVPKGQNYSLKWHAIIFDKNRSLTIRKGVDILPFKWIIEKENLTHMKTFGLDHIHQLALKQDNEFQKMTLRFFVDYGGSFIARSVSEKILRLVVALEKFLSPSADGPTQTTIADRLAFTIGSDQADRRRIVKTTKIIYGWRSRLVHSALDVSEEETFEEFLRDVWRFFVFLTRSLDSFATIEEFYEHLEQSKYS